MLRTKIIKTNFFVNFKRWFMPSDRVRKKITNYADVSGDKIWNMRRLCGKDTGLCIVNKFIIKPFECTEQQWNKKHFKALPTNKIKLANFDMCLIYLWYWLKGISSFTQFFQASILAQFVLCSLNVRSLVTRYFPRKYFAGSSPKIVWITSRFKIRHKQNGVFLSPF